MYKASYYGDPKIEEVEVTDTTSKMVVLKGGQRVKQEARFVGYFPTMGEARTFLAATTLAKMRVIEGEINGLEKVLMETRIHFHMSKLTEVTGRGKLR